MDLVLAVGDAYSSLTHNLEAIALEKRFQSDLKPDTSIYRSAAVQIIAKGILYVCLAVNVMFRQCEGVV